MSLYANTVNWFSTTRLGGWIARRLAARVDPFLYRVSGGRFTSTGTLTIPQLVLTTIGRKTGEARTVQLGYFADGGDFVIVASNFGQPRHPAWAYSLLANPAASIYVDGHDVGVHARQVSDDEKSALWPRLVRVIPRFGVYVTRTHRNVKVFRLTPDATS